MTAEGIDVRGLAEPPGPGPLETYRRLRGSSLAQFPAFLHEIESEYGSIASFRVPWRRFYFFNDPEAIKDVLVNKQHDFVKSEGTRAMRELLGYGLVTSEDPLHRRMRRIVQPAFHRQRIAGYTRVMHEYANAWRAPSDAFDMHAQMMELTLRIASTTLFGADAGAESDRVAAALHEVVTVFPEVLGPFGFIVRRLPLPPTLRFRRARRVLDAIVFQLIDERRAANAEREDALSLLLQARDGDSGEALDDGQLRDEVMTLFVAGHETTANALTWVWYLLARNPHVGARLRAELAANEEAPYLDAVLNETLRLYPPAWILGRDARRDVEIAGNRLRRRGTVLISPLLMHRNPVFFQNPHAFVPERWLEEWRLPQFAYFPFGGGARKCIGDAFAWSEARITLATLASRYRFELLDEREIEPEPIITLRPRGAVMMRVLD